MSVIFLGDSITEGFKQLKEIDIINMGISGNRTLEVLERLDSVYEKNPNELYLMIGINDFMNNKGVWFNDLPIDIRRTYEYLTKQLVENLPQTKLHLLSILPVASGMLISELDVKQYNIEIDELNAFIKTVADRYKIDYIDLNKYFKDSQNNMKKEYTYDSIHLTELGYELFYKKIIKKLHKFSNNCSQY